MHFVPFSSKTLDKYSISLPKDDATNYFLQVSFPDSTQGNLKIDTTNEVT